jgi:hypothetical protein
VAVENSAPVINGEGASTTKVGIRSGRLEAFAALTGITNIAKSTPTISLISNPP